MKRYFIETAKCGITDGGMACGPIPGNVVVSVQFKEESELWLNVVEVEGMPNFYLTDKDIFDDLVKEDDDDEEFMEYLQEQYIDEFNGLYLDCDYTEVFTSIDEDPDNPAVPLIRYAIALIRCAMEDVEGLIDMASGKYADELEIPTSDIEEEYREELEYELEDEEDDAAEGRFLDIYKNEDGDLIIEETDRLMPPQDLFKEFKEMEQHKRDKQKDD